MKRFFDIVASLIAIVVCGLLMAIIAVAIRMESPGGAIFRQRRVGWRGKPFYVLKFRTMRADADPYGASPRSGEDPRLTRVGRLLREKSMDELPQLFNVLAGQMSLVGPRPLYERQAELWDQRQRRRLEVRPGLTGYAQVYGRAAMAHEDKIELDLVYVERQGLLLDLKILLTTVVGAFTGRGDIYERRYSRQKERECDS
jgi:lipopolysaccharide/colanic/teichoic acid biosynthesis glycosyltransferase